MTVYEWDEILGDLIADLKSLQKFRERYGAGAPSTGTTAEIIEILQAKSSVRDTRQFLFQEANRTAAALVIEGYEHIRERLEGEGILLPGVTDLPSAIAACASWHQCQHT